MATVGLPLTGAGDATAQVAVDTIAGEAFQRIKLFDGTEGSTMALVGKTSAPNSSDPGLLVRPIGGTTAFSLSSQITVTASGTSKVDVSSGVILGAGSSANMLGQVFATGTTKVDVSSGVILGAGSSANILGSVTNAPATSGTLIGAVSVTSGVVLGAGSSANMLGQVQATGTTKVDVSSGVILGAGSSANMLGQVQATGTTKVDVSSGVILGAGSSANVLGAVAQGPASSANFWFTQSIPYSSANMARTTVNTTVDISIIAANASRKALVIANLSTAQIVALGLSTGAVTTGLTNANLFLPPNSQLSFGIGDLPLFLGPVRGINISSTVLAGGVAVMEFT